MTAQTNQPPVQSVSKTPVSVISHATNVRPASAKTAKTDTTSKLASAPVASLEISDVGREMAAHFNYKVNNLADAKQQVNVIHEQLKAKPEIVYKLHSNLRAIKINNLIFD